MRVRNDFFRGQLGAGTHPRHGRGSSYELQQVATIEAEGLPRGISIRGEFVLQEIAERFAVRQLLDALPEARGIGAREPGTRGSQIGWIFPCFAFAHRFVFTGDMWNRIAMS